MNRIYLNLTVEVLQYEPMKYSLYSVQEEWTDYCETDLEIVCK